MAALLLPTPCLAQSDAGPLVIGGYRTPQPNRLELLLELPPGLPANFAKVQAAEIQLLEDAQATTRASAVNGFREAGWTVATVVAIDTSGSMKAYLDPVRAALPDFIATQSQNDSVALITFDNEVHSKVPFAAPRDQIMASIKGLKTFGTRTVLHRALEESLTLLQGRTGERMRRRILVVSDGADESSSDPSFTDAIIKRAVGPNANVAIDTIWLGRPVAAGRDTLVRLAERTGGIKGAAVTPARAEADMKAALNDIRQISTTAVVASFDRRIRTDANTRQIGVSLARPGIADASLALQIPRSSVGPVTPRIGTPPPPTLVDRIVYWTIRLLPALLAAYGAYVALYLIAKRAKWKVRLFNPIWWHSATPIVIIDKGPSPPEPPKPPPPPRRVTRVADDRPLHGAGGVAPGMALEAVDGPMRGQRIAIAGPRFQIGAGTNNELRITTDTYLSGMHARIEHSQGQWTLIDLESSNGTFVDGRRLTSGKAHQLRDGESLRMGASEFRVVLSPVVAAAATPGAEPPVTPKDRTQLQ